MTMVVSTVGTTYACCQNPIASFTAPSSAVCVDCVVPFSAGASYDPDGTTPLSYSWSFGDGAYGITGGNTASPTCKYSSSGTKTVTLTVTDNDNPDCCGGQGGCSDKSNSTSRTVTIVEVSKIQYLDPDTGYTDITGTLYVCVGTIVTFKAIPNPSGVSWPGAVWDGTCGASGSGEIAYVKFDTLSSSTTDCNTVTATCGNTVTAYVIVFELDPYLMPDEMFDLRSYYQYGVEETVDLGHFTIPAGITGLPLEWQKVSGVGLVFASTYDAEAVPGNVTLRLGLTSGPSRGFGYIYTRTVVAPTNRYIHAEPPWNGIYHLQGVPSCKFIGDSYLDPKNVSFTNIQRREGTSAPATVTGYFERVYGKPGPTHPIGSWFTPSDPNSTTGCHVVQDESGFEVSPDPQDAGTFSWDIMYQYKGDDGVPRDMHTITAYKELFVDGKVKVDKGSVGPFEKAKNDPNSSFYTGP
jgi:hypothetical protein